MSSLRNMARDSRRADSRRVVAVGNSSGGGATVRCKLVLVFLVLLLAIIVPAAYAEHQGESHRDFLFSSVVSLTFLNTHGAIQLIGLFIHGDTRYKHSVIYF